MIELMGNIVFTNGALAEPDGTLKLYYGGADTCMNVATARIDDLIDLALDDGPDATVRYTGAVE